MPGIQRTIVKEARFERELAEIEPRARKADEYISGAEWVLSRDAEEGMPVAQGARTHMLFMAAHDELPGATIYYYYDDHYVYLLSIRLTVQGFGD